MSRMPSISGGFRAQAQRTGKPILRYAVLTGEGAPFYLTNDKDEACDRGRRLGLRVLDRKSGYYLDTATGRRLPRGVDRA